MTALANQCPVSQTARGLGCSGSFWERFFLPQIPTSSHPSFPTSPGSHGPGLCFPKCSHGVFVAGVPCLAQVLSARPRRSGDSTSPFSRLTVVTFGLLPWLLRVVLRRAPGRGFRAGVSPSLRALSPGLALRGVRGVRAPLFEEPPNSCPKRPLPRAPHRRFQSPRTLADPCVARRLGSRPVGGKWRRALVLVRVSLMMRNLRSCPCARWPCVCLLWRNVC